MNTGKSLGSTVNFIRRQRIKSGVKNNSKTKIRTFLIYGKCPLIISKKILIIRMQLNTVKPRFFYSVKFFKSVLCIRMHAPKSIYFIRHYLLCPTVYDFLLRRFRSNRQNYRFINSRIIHYFKKSVYSSVRIRHDSGRSRKITHGFFHNFFRKSMRMKIYYHFISPLTLKLPFL